MEYQGQQLRVGEDLRQATGEVIAGELEEFQVGKTAERGGHGRCEVVGPEKEPLQRAKVACDVFIIYCINKYNKSI
jgi:hypothetical protein